LIDSFWILKNINQRVKNYLSKSPYSKEFDDNTIKTEMTKLHETLAYVDHNFKDFDFFYVPRTKAQAMYNMPKTKWVFKVSDMLRQRSRARLFKFSFMSFYNSSKYDNFYDNLVSNHLQVGGFLAYGSSRNKYVKQTNFSESDNLDPLPVYYNARYVESRYFFDYLKNIFFKIDDALYEGSLPY
jgi:hypothetical protein